LPLTLSIKLRLDQAAAEIQARAAALAAKAALDIEARARELAPVDTGALRNSIQAFEVDRFHWIVTSPVHYSAFQEYGTSRMAAQPYMTPALEAVRPIVEAQARRLAQ